MIFVLSLFFGASAAVNTAMAQNGNMNRPRNERERDERHPKIRQAINALERAKDDLQDASHDFCGHREEALDRTNNAISQLRLALASDRAANLPAENGAPVQFINASFDRQNRGDERHPKIRQAISALERAKDDLQDASRDFHGHREQALDAVNQALSQLRQALNCDKR